MLDLSRRVVTERGVTVVIVTHDPQVMDEADRIYELQDGALHDSWHKSD